MCAVAIPLIAAGVGAAATIYSAQQASSDAAAAREESARQYEAARKQQTQAGAASESSTDVTAAVDANRRRVAGMSGMGSTITGAGTSYAAQNASGLGVGQKKQLGM